MGVYKRLGLSTRQAIGRNLLAACISYGGLFTGLAISSDPEATQWLLALVAAVFIYLCLVYVLPEMKFGRESKRRYYRLFLQNIGMLTGFTIMALIAVYEEDITSLGQ